MFSHIYTLYIAFMSDLVITFLSEHCITFKDTIRLCAFNEPSRAFKIEQGSFFLFYSVHLVYRAKRTIQPLFARSYIFLGSVSLNIQRRELKTMPRS